MWLASCVLFLSFASESRKVANLITSVGQNYSQSESLMWKVCASLDQMEDFNEHSVCENVSIVALMYCQYERSYESQCADFYMDVNMDKNMPTHPDPRYRGSQTAQ